MAKRQQSEDAEFALIGARVRLQELEAEIARIKARFPALSGGGTGTGGGGAEKPKKRGRSFTPEQRAEAAERARKMWAARKKASKGGAKKASKRAAKGAKRKGATAQENAEKGE